MEIRLQADADSGKAVAQLLGQVERDVDVGRLLHVDPQIVTGGLRAFGDREEMRPAASAIDVEAELRRLDRRLAREADRFDLGDALDVVIGHRLRFAKIGDVLTEAGEHAGDSLRGQLARRLAACRRTSRPA